MDITAIVRNDYSGNCELFAVPGPYDFISWVVGVSEEQMLQIQLQIEIGGYVKALLAPGTHWPVSTGNDRTRQRVWQQLSLSKAAPLGPNRFLKPRRQTVDFATLLFRESMHGVNDDES
jgi:hypothetical protein